MTLRTLRDFAETYTLHVDCPSCRHHAPLDAVKAARIAGWEVSINTLKARLRCVQCGHRGGEVRICHDGRPFGCSPGAVTVTNPHNVRDLADYRKGLIL